MPSRYEVCTGIIIDSNGNTSEQIDVIIYDKFYSPIVFSDKNTKYVLVESVFAAFEVKQTLSTQHINYAIKKYNTISKLSPTNKEILMADGRKIKKTILSPVISGILVKKNELKKIPENTLNFICCLNNILKVDFKENKLTVKENVLLNLLMSLVQSLQMVGNPPAIEFNKY
ncbi:hypothetical protein FACS189459_1430 [Bacilli bacterium]|nr:hypothetical protein FACS189459_1430 [Bacilli bacterium]